LQQEIDKLEQENNDKPHELADKINQLTTENEVLVQAEKNKYEDIVKKLEVYKSQNVIEKKKIDQLHQELNKVKEELNIQIKKKTLY